MEAKGDERPEGRRVFYAAGTVGDVRKGLKYIVNIGRPCAFTAVVCVFPACLIVWRPDGKAGDRGEA